jgi:hypothetical protein
LIGATFEIDRCLDLNLDLGAANDVVDINGEDSANVGVAKQKPITPQIIRLKFFFIS